MGSSAGTGTGLGLLRGQALTVAVCGMRYAVCGMVIPLMMMNRFPDLFYSSFFSSVSHVHHQ